MQLTSQRQKIAISLINITTKQIQEKAERLPLYGSTKKFLKPRFKYAAMVKKKVTYENHFINNIITTNWIDMIEYTLTIKPFLSLNSIELRSFPAFSDGLYGYMYYI